MLNLKKAEIIGYHSYCEGSSRTMVIEASEEVWATQSQSSWEGQSERGSVDHECLHTNVKIHGTPAGKASLLNCRELCCISGTLSELSSVGSGREGARVDTVQEPSCGNTLILIAPWAYVYSPKVRCGSP
jgi:hypothetical protein